MEPELYFHARLCIRTEENLTKRESQYIYQVPQWNAKTCTGIPTDPPYILHFAVILLPSVASLNTGEEDDIF
jgi:hypothetical protein